jgi:hypothetical protein
MAKLKRSVNECIALVKDVEDGFDKWLEIAMELSQAATQTQGMLDMKTSQSAGYSFQQEQLISSSGTRDKN